MTGSPPYTAMAYQVSDGLGLGLFPRIPKLNERTIPMAITENALPAENVAAEAAAIVLAGHPDYRILRRVGNAALLATPLAVDMPTRIGAIVDVETSGLDPQNDKIIELAILRFRFTETGQITEVDRARSWREDPGFPLNPAVTSLTGLTDADLAGKSIDAAEATAILASADVLVAHNAAFDAKFVEARLPAVAGHAWACSLHEIDWPTHGFEARRLGLLLMEAGYFFDPHRAEQDVLALLFLLAHRSHGGRPLLASLIASAEQAAVRIDAIGAPYASRDALKGRGYQWRQTDRCWGKEVAECDVDAEQYWLAQNNCGDKSRKTKVTWRQRYR